MLQYLDEDETIRHVAIMKTSKFCWAPRSLMTDELNNYSVN